jgi:hypothetical protein
VNRDTQVKPILSKLVQVGVVIRNLENTASHLASLGLGPFKPSKPPPGAEGMIFHDKPLAADPKGLCADIGDTELELLQPGEGDSPWKEFLDHKGEGIQHIALQVDNIDEVLAGLNGKGAKTLLTGKAHGRLAAAYVDLGVGNIIVELLQRQ